MREWPIQQAARLMSQSNPGFESGTAAAQPTSSPFLMNRFLSGEALIVVACILVYWPALRGDFIFDDDLHLTQNQLVQAHNGLARIWYGSGSHIYWPVTNTIYWLEWRLWGANPAGYHVVNLLLHAATALLLWSVLQELAVPALG